jgi:hypothetical protein
MKSPNGASPVFLAGASAHIGDSGWVRSSSQVTAVSSLQVTAGSSFGHGVKAFDELPVAGATVCLRYALCVRFVHGFVPLGFCACLQSLYVIGVLAREGRRGEGCMPGLMRYSMISTMNKSIKWVFLTQAKRY